LFTLGTSVLALIYHKEKTVLVAGFLIVIVVYEVFMIILNKITEEV
jgi:hypothetical protein